MFAYNDAWLMNESLALYMSTNTFSNPLFNQNLNPSDYVGSDGDQIDQTMRPSSYLKATAPAAPVIGSMNDFGDEDDDDIKCTQFKKPSFAQRLRNLTDPSQWAANHKQRWLDLYDGMAYSIRSKAFVWELNLKRNLKALRRFAIKNISWMLPISSTTDHNDNKRAHTTNNNNNNNNNSASLQISDSFWQSLDQLEPNSKSSINIQQEQLLSRLERVVQAKRSGQLKRNLEEIASVTGHCSSISLADAAGARNVVGRHRIVEEFIHPVGAYGGNDLTWDDTNEQQQQQQQVSSASSTGHSARTGCNGPHLRQSSVDSTAASLSMTTSASFTSIGAVSLPVRKNNAANRTTAGHRPTISIGQRSKQRYRLSGVSRSKSVDQRDLKTTKSCIVCYANFPNIVTLPCKHNNVCSDCLIEIIYMAVKQKQFPLKCVLCRQKVEQIRVSRKWLISVIGKDQTIE